VTKDATLTVALVAAFALLVTLHVATCYRLLRRHHVAEGLGALVVPPLAPYLAFTRGMRGLAIAWIACAALYAAALWLAR
jgi:hypothetical protein